MANSAFPGSITTSGTSEAIRLDKAFFRSHPEFRQKAKVRANVIARGQILISLVEEVPAQEPDNDPVVNAFLSFLAQDMETHPRRVAKLSKSVVTRARKLTKGVVVADNEIIPDGITF